MELRLQCCWLPVLVAGAFSGLAAGAASEASSEMPAPGPMGTWPISSSGMPAPGLVGTWPFSSHGMPAPGPVGTLSDDRELLLKSAWAGRLGWNRTLPMCGELCTWNHSFVDAAATRDFYGACYCRRPEVITSWGLSIEDICNPEDEVAAREGPSWGNVICNQQHQVIALCLSDHQLEGNPPPEWVALSRLRFLDISNNTLQGTLPGEWVRLEHLTVLYLHTNNISGSLPPQWSGMQNLTRLVLSSNSLQGSLPGEWGQLKHLAVVDMATNNLSGSLPPQWSGMQNLKHLSLSNNSLQGSLPSDWGLLKHLAVLDMATNKLSGSLPPQWSGLQNLTRLFLYENRLQGSLPGEWAQLKHLTQLYMHANILSGSLPPQWSGMQNLTELLLSENSLQGSLPGEWGHLKHLAILAMHTNNLSGPLPQQWSGMVNLTVLGLSTNSLNGSLPSEWGQLKHLVFLDVITNNLGGPLPPQWSGMKNLKELKLSDNNFQGSLPREWSNLSALSFLSVYRNRLTGTLPLREWAGLTDLDVLSAFSNRFTGSLPSEAQLPSFVFLADNQLSGPLSGNMSRTFFLDLGNNNLSGSLPDQLHAPLLEWLNISGNLGLDAPVPDCWLYHRECLPKLAIFGDEGLLRATALSYSWRKRNCRDALAFQWGDLRNITGRFQELLEKMTRGSHPSVFVGSEPIQDDVRNLCNNDNVGQVLGWLWGSFVVLILGGYALRKKVIPLWHAFLQSSWGPGGRFLNNMASMVNASLYWYDWVTDIMVIQEVWPGWSGGLLLAFALLNYVVSGCVMVFHAFRLARAEKGRPPADVKHVGLVQWTVGWPLITAVMPLLDTVVLLLYLLKDAHMSFIEIRGLDTEGFMQMRDVVKALTTSLPTAVLTSVVYARGNLPDVGLVYTEVRFVASLVGSLLLLLWAWYSSLLECQAEGIRMRELLRMIFTGKTLWPEAAESVPQSLAVPHHQEPSKRPDELPFVTHVEPRTRAPKVQILHVEGATVEQNKAPAGGMRAEEDCSCTPAAMGGNQTKPGPALLAGLQRLATPIRRVYSAPTDGCNPSEPTRAVVAGNSVVDQRAAARTHPREREGQRLDVVKTGVAPSHARDNDKGAPRGVGASTDDEALKSAKEGSENSQAAPVVGKALRHRLKDVGLWLLRHVVRAVLVLGPVATIILLDVFKEHD